MFEDIKFEGNFKLDSGKKSKYYYGCDLILPSRIRKYGRQLIQTFRLQDYGFPFIAAPALGAIPLAFSMACDMDLPLIVVEKDRAVRGDTSILMDNFLIVEDVISTYGSVEWVQEVLNCKAGGAACLIFRGKEEDPSLPTWYLEKGEIET